MHHCPRRGHEIRLADVVALFFFLHHAADELGQLFVGSAAPHLGVQVVVPHGEQAGADFAVAGDADAAAVSAEGMRDRSDDSDFADAVVEAIAAGGFACARAEFRPAGGTLPCASRISSSVTTVSGDQVRSSSSGMNSMKRTVTPSSRANMPKGMIWSSLKPRMRTQLTFTGHSPARRAARIPASTWSYPLGTRVMRAKRSGSTASMLDRDASQASILQRLRHLGEKMAVGGQRDDRGALRHSIGDAAWPVRARNQLTPLRSSGSPPVRRIFVIPAPTNTRAMRR